MKIRYKYDNNRFIMIVIFFLCIAACARKSFESLDETGAYMISYSLVPDKKYTISAQFISKYSSSLGTSESDYSYEFLLETGDLSNIEISTTDTSFHNRSIYHNLKIPIRGNLIPEYKQEEGSKISYSTNGREVIVSDSLIHTVQYSNLFNTVGIKTWNSQEELPNCSMHIGESLVIESSDWEFYSSENRDNLIFITTNYTLDSVNNNKCYLQFDSQFHWQDSLPNHARKEYGTLVYDIKNKHYSRMEKYRENVKMENTIINSKRTTIETTTSSHEVVEISVLDE